MCKIRWHTINSILNTPRGNSSFKVGKSQWSQKVCSLTFWWKSKRAYWSPCQLYHPTPNIRSLIRKKPQKRKCLTYPPSPPSRVADEIPGQHCLPSCFQTRSTAATTRPGCWPCPRPDPLLHCQPTLLQAATATAEPRLLVQWYFYYSAVPYSVITFNQQ